MGNSRQGCGGRLKTNLVRTPRIFLGLTEVSGYFSRLQRGLQELGVDAVHVTVHEHRFGYSAGQVPWMVAWSRSAVARRGESQGSRLAKWARVAEVAASRIVLLAWAIARFDVFILGAGSSFFNLRELALLRLLNKRIIYTLHGTDARPPYIDGFFPALRKLLDTARDDRVAVEGTMDALAVETARRVRFLRRLEKYANVVVCGPSYGQLLSRPYVNLYAIGLPTPLPEKIGRVTGGDEHSPLVVLHAPSQVAGKGTAIIREVVARLRGSGVNLDYREITGRPNHEVMAALMEADMVVDQVWSDTPMAGLAAEAGARGCPALVGGYFSAIAAKAVPPQWLPPTEFTLPEEMEAKLCRMASDRKRLVAMGLQAREFVATQWSERAVASKMLQLLQSVPPDWLVDPGTCHYFEGIGLDREQARWTVWQMIERHGLDVLGLQHAPALQAEFLAFARREIAHA